MPLFFFKVLVAAAFVVAFKQTFRIFLKLDQEPAPDYVISYSKFCRKVNFFTRTWVKHRDQGYEVAPRRVAQSPVT